MNIFNPAPAGLSCSSRTQISRQGLDAVTEANQIDGYSGATALGRIAGSST